MDLVVAELATVAIFNGHPTLVETTPGMWVKDVVAQKPQVG